MALYRVFTENINRNQIEGIASKHFDGFTLLDSTGYWKGCKEKSLVIEVISNKNIKPEINAMANEIKIANKQESVLVQKIANNNWLV